MNITGNFTDEQGDSSLTESPVLHATRVVLYIFLCVIGVIGNGCVCFLVLKKRKFHTSGGSGAFILNLAISDLLVVLMILPFELAYIEMHSRVWVYGLFMCKFVYTVGDLSVTVSGTTLIAISYERYRCICTTAQRQPLSNSRTVLIIIAIWVYSVLTLLPFTLSLEVTQTGECLNDFNFWPSELSFKLTSVFLVLIPCFGLPMLCTSIFYVLIMRHLRRHQASLAREQNASLRNVAFLRARQNQKTLKILTGLVIVFFICILPQQIVMLMGMFNSELLGDSKMMLAYELTRLLSSANSIANPILYGGLSRKFRRKVLACVRCIHSEIPVIRTRANHEDKLAFSSRAFQTTASIRGSRCVQENCSQL